MLQAISQEHDALSNVCSQSQAKHVVHMRKPLESHRVPWSESKAHTLDKRESIIMQVDCGAVSHFTLNHSIWNVGIHLNTPYCLPLAGHYCCFISHIHIIQKAHTAHTLVCGLALDFLLLHTLAGRCKRLHIMSSPQRLLYVFIWSGDALLNVIIEWPPRKDTVAASEIYSPVCPYYCWCQRGLKRASVGCRVRDLRQ